MRACRGILAFIVALTLAASTPNAPAQGTDGTLPDPISAQRLERYAEMLRLSAQQRHALAALHAEYRAEFQELRESEIDEFLKLRRSGYQLLESVPKQRELINRIAAIDGRLFDRVQEMLVEAQLLKLARVRNLREREGIMGLRMWQAQFSPRPFDLGEALVQVGVTADEREAIDFILAEYEPKLTALLRRGLDDHFGYARELHAEFVRQGFDSDRLAREIDAAFEVAEPVWAKWLPRLNQSVDEMLALQRRTVQELAPFLPEPKVHALRLIAYQMTYASTSHAASALALERSPSGEAMQHAALSDEQRAALEDVARQFRREVTAAMDAFAARMDAHRRKFNTPQYDRNQEFTERNAIDEDADEDFKRLLTLHDTLRKSAAEIAGVAANPLAPVEPEAADPLTVDLANVSLQRLLFGRQEVAAWLPPAISARDLTLYGEWMELDEPRRAHLSSAHERYLNEFARFREGAGEAMRVTSRALHAGDTVEGYTADNVRRYRAARAAATAAQRALDEAFFAAVLEALDLDADDAGLQRSRLARQRQWLNSGIYGSQTMQPGGRYDDFFDLSFLLRRVAGVDLGQPEVDRILAAYEQALTPLLKARQEAMFAYRAVEDDLRVDWQERRLETGEEYPDMSDRRAEREVEKLRRAAVVAAGPIAELNRATIEQLAQALPADAAERVRQMFDRMSWPRIYGDPACAAPSLAGALGLDDLTPPQLAQVENIAAEFHAAYRDSCLRMIAAAETGDAPMRLAQPSEQDWLDYNVRRQERMRLAFERHELNLRTLHRLRSILTPEQTARLGGLPDPPEFVQQEYGS